MVVKRIANHIRIKHAETCNGVEMIYNGFRYGE